MFFVNLATFLSMHFLQYTSERLALNIRQTIQIQGESNDLNLNLDLSVNSNDVESLCIEIQYKKNKNILFSVVYRRPNGDMTISEKFCENLLSANDKTSENIIFAGDLNINVLGGDYIIPACRDEI